MKPTDLLALILCLVFAIPVAYRVGMYVGFRRLVRLSAEFVDSLEGLLRSAGIDPPSNPFWELLEKKKRNAKGD
jgi:hypothetical protein